ncbi:NepR family anti-sigma factor [Aestuariivita sp.]|jgi:hypothetical protein|uniref:NepR family anti-sigma factor n=1 Tax=Aestuariivita sp. TaxID=1872407 RepID=UPI00216CFD02|nr:NepR family anti-sigma factor [Aestuariivita sp.]MCE8007432.1 hypothetical protein [Aestuariivita sp.]
MAQNKQRPKGQDTIDENLKRVYQDTLEEEVPDRFRALLDQLKAQDAAQSRQSNGDET